MRKYMTIEEYLKTQSITKEKSNKKVFKNIIGLMCLSIIIFSLYNILNWYCDNSKIRQINQEIDENTSSTNNSKEGTLINPPIDKKSDYYYYVTFPFYEVGFSTLLSKNNDTVGFIHVRNTNIDYPIVQGKDNQYYLKHSFDKEKNNAGWVFLDYRSNMEDLGDNTIIYGHARLDGSMFGSLKNTLSSSWQNDRNNYVIFISTPKENMIFQIFSIYTIKSEGYYIKPNFSSNSKKQEWIDTVKKRNTAPIDTKVDTNDKFLTLSTCQNDYGGRIVVHAKLIKKQKNEMNQ